MKHLLWTEYSFLPTLNTAVAAIYAYSFHKKGVKEGSVKYLVTTMLSPAIENKKLSTYFIYSYIIIMCPSFSKDLTVAR